VLEAALLAGLRYRTRRAVHEGQQSRLEEGNEVGLLAQSRFPGGVLVGAEHGLDGALAQTNGLLEDSSVPAIFEATFKHRGVLVRVDLLRRRRVTGGG
jgi:hypothetical protein